jgi:hypothetical protein
MLMFWRRRRRRRRRRGFVVANLQGGIGRVWRC